VKIVIFGGKWYGTSNAERLRIAAPGPVLPGLVVRGGDHGAIAILQRAACEHGRLVMNRVAEVLIINEAAVEVDCAA
jgi:hypothetical protein